MNISDTGSASELEGMVDGFMAFDGEWHITRFNAAAERSSGRRRSDLLGMNYWEAFPDVVGTNLEREFRQVMSNRGTRKLENYYEPFDRWFEMAIYAAKDGGIAIQGRDITERKNAEKALRRSEACFRALFEYSHHGILIADDSSTFVDANPAAAEVFGIPVEQIIGKSLYDFIEVERGPSTEQLWREFIDAGFQQSEFNILRPDGQVRVLEYSAVANVQPGQHLSTLHDITGHRLTEDALRAGEARFRSYFELGLIGMAITSPTQGILEVNDEICRILGYEREEMLQMTWAQMTHPDDLPADIALYNQVMSGETEGYSIDKRWIRKDGRIIDSTISVTCLRRPDNSVDYFVALLQDITQRKRTEAALQESEAYFRAVADMVPDLLWRRDATGAVEWFNRQWTDYTGQSSEEAGGLGWLDVVHTDDRESALATLRLALLSGQPLRDQRRLRGTDGSYRWFLVRMQPIHDERGQITHWFAAATDIHHEREAQDELEDRVREGTAALGHAISDRQAETEAREATEQELYETNQRLRTLSGRLLEIQEEERRALARELHDEIGQQLTVARLMVERLAPSGEKYERAPDMQQLDSILTLIDSMSTRVRELSLNLRPSMLDDEGLGPALLWQTERYTQMTGIEVKLAYRGLEDRLTATIETAVYRIVQEALTNVARHAGVKQVTVQVLVDELVTILIEDTGRGFDVEEVLKTHTTGLSGMRERVELLGGQFTTESRPGEGTRIIAEIPVSNSSQ
jgi:PAS domain S-box-containing protein